MSARNFCKAVIVLAIMALGYFSLQLAWADALFRASTRSSVRSAAEKDSGNASYHAWLAELEEHDGRDPSPELEIASRLNPSDSKVWIRRGLRAENERDFTQAERFLLHAA